MPDGVQDVSGAGVSLEPDHGGALADPAHGLAEVLGAAHEGDGEGALVDVVQLVRARQHLRLVDAVRVQGLDYLSRKLEV